MHTISQRRKEMKVAILAGGFGRRLTEETGDKAEADGRNRRARDVCWNRCGILEDLGGLITCVYL